MINQFEDYHTIKDGGWGWQRILLLLILFQSIGIRVFPMQGVVMGITISLIIITRISLPFKQFYVIITACLVYLMLSMRGLTNYTPLVYSGFIMLNSLLYLRYVNDHWAQLEYDLLNITWMLSLHALLSFSVYVTSPSLFINLDNGQLRYNVLGPFVVSGWHPVRATGLCWEPGLLQYVSNLSLFLGIKHSWPRWKLFISFATVLVSSSTAGIIVLAVNLVYLLISARKDLLYLSVRTATLALIVIISATFFSEDIEDKFGGKNVSGLIRLRDFEIGLELLRQKPLLGHGQFDEQYLLNNSRIYGLATKLFTKEYLAVSSELSGGYTNGLLGFVSSYGIPLGFLSLICFFYNGMIQGDFKDRSAFFMISILTFFSEPITNTPFFLFLVISGLSSEKIKKLFKYHNIRISSVNHP